MSLSAYEKKRLANIKRNQGVLDQLGLVCRPATDAQKPKAKRSRVDPDRAAALELTARRSSRLSGRPAQSYKEDPIELRNKRPRVWGGSDDDYEYDAAAEQSGEGEVGRREKKEISSKAKAQPAGDPRSSKFAYCDIARMDREQVRPPLIRGSYSFEDLSR